MIQPAPTQAVLFDLDGTLVNTAPDLVNALNTVLRDHQHPEVSVSEAAPYISTGAAGMLEFAMGTSELPDRQHMVDSLVDHYHQHIADASRLFPDMEKVLQALEQTGLSWGVVTNKITRLTDTLLSALNLTERAACIVCGDTTSYSKPHPAPLLEACRLINHAPNHCLYIGDARSDIEAASRAMMPSLAAGYGFLHDDDNPQHWGANAVIYNPTQILDWIANNV